MITKQEFWTLFFQILLVKITGYNNCDLLAENIQEHALKTILNYRNHPSIMAIGEVCKRNPQFSFRCVNKDEILKEILDLDVKRFKSLSGFGYPIKNY